MKNAYITFLLAVVFWSSAGAQPPVKQIANVREDQVPVVVRIAFEKDFGSVPENGFWTVQVVRVLDGEHQVTKPQWYSFNKREKHERIEVRYSPEGELLSHQGLVRKSDGPHPSLQDVSGDT